MSVKNTTTIVGPAVVGTGMLPYTGLDKSDILLVSLLGAALLIAGILLHHWASKRA